MTVSPSGWIPSNVAVVQPARPWGAGDALHTVVQLTICASDFPGSQTYASNIGSMALPGPSHVGLSSIRYVIPICPFFHVTVAGRFLSWGYHTPTGAVTNPNGHIVVGSVIGATPSQGPSYGREQPSARAVSTIFTTDTMRAYGIFVGN